MILRVAAACAVLMCVGCGDDTSATGGDLAAAADLSISPDLTNLSCANILACDVGCGQNLVCQQACRNAGTISARSAFEGFAGCVALTCSPFDGGAAACSGPTDSSAACQACLTNIAAQAPAVGRPCHAEYIACVSS